MSATVKIIGICGHPKHGKSAAQLFLQHQGVTPVDDSRTLRRLAMIRYGLSWDDVTTQEGKARYIRRPDYGDTVAVRQAIGDLGKEYETKHGPNYWMERAIAKAKRYSSPISFGSVRMGQAHAIRAAGGLTIAVVNPRLPLSTHDFDQFDPAGVDCWVQNDGDLALFERRVLQAAAPYLHGEQPRGTQ
jgi:hypothetical protein|uniref:hypothetical protein n=1 Tax=Sphingomonas sp. NFR04 TaxID=1566283 RepID=UPI0008E10BFF|nr:hypothetical protein [Sphingomonas sp. NFR04]SFJ51415.1 hypothetical protein SAMN03159338_1623 [Sphingomonas sp. NFR04]